MRRIVVIIYLLLTGFVAAAQDSTITDNSLLVTVVNGKQEVFEGTTVELLSANDSMLVKAGITGTDGTATFSGIPAGNYFFRVSRVGFETAFTLNRQLPQPVAERNRFNIVLSPATSNMHDVTVVGTRPLVQHVQGKTLINVEAAVTNVGTTVLEVLEKSPGVMVDKNGSISLQAKTGVLVLIDDKPTYLSGTELANLLGSMPSSQVDQIELMVNPPAKYDASGNAGIINIKTKKNKQQGFNGSLTISGGQGRYPKNNNSLVMNYRNGRVNVFLTYSLALNKYYTDIYAYRRYFRQDGSVGAVLDQFSSMRGKIFNNTLKTGLDYNLSDKTTVGIVLTGVAVSRKGNSDALATWMDETGSVDSAVNTYSNTDNRFKNVAINLNLRRKINQQQEIAVDVDWLNYDIQNQQYFNSKLATGSGFNEASKGDIPSTIHIFSGKADHTLRFGENGKLESGWKSSHISTDNLAAYQLYDGNAWGVDYGKSNHFLYTENIHALYSSYETKYKRFNMQGGLRYEYTGYDANQLGNPTRKDSAFSRNYQALFPSGYISYQADSSNGFTLTAGRRIDRPAFQKLNPFVFIINKYTYQRGNPFFLPQFSWNMELSHQYKNLLTTAVSYSIIKNYFSQLFLADSNDILVYSEGNVGRAYNVGVSVTLQAAPFRWWSFTSQVVFNHKDLRGYNGKDFTSSIDQLNVNLNNQFRIGKIYTGELSGFYTTRARNDLQELLYPTGQLSLGLARPVLQKKGTIKISMRDIFYTQAMEGLTQFEGADEYFKLNRDTRVFNISFTWRFGKPLKTIRRSGGATDEQDRVGNG